MKFMFRAFHSKLQLSFTESWYGINLLQAQRGIEKESQKQRDKL